ncbi:MAG: glucose-1-phosphate thymidylyltransferase [Candidatus Aenigmatarchaeota archaeon]|nr:MAG: glucose-1-phosphate thymidylyltransferase [Candidatus Aenigmarchaeota archaeon]
MQAVILAAGKSTRTYPLTINKPKVLLRVANKPVLEYNLDALNGLVDEVVLVLGFKKEMVMEYAKKYSERTGLKVKFAFQEEQLGTAHALLCAEKFIDSDFLVLMGDDIYHPRDLENLIENKYSVLARKEKNPQRFGIWITENSKVTGFQEKPEKPLSDTANCGAYCLGKEVFQEIKKLKKSPRGEYELNEAVAGYAEREDVKVCMVEGYWLSIGYPWDVLNANEFFLSKIKETRIEGQVEKNATLKGPVRIGKNTLVRNGAYIEGPVVIGENCAIGPNCFIRAFTTIGSSCRIGNAVEIKNSVIGDSTNVGHLSYVGDSVIGDKVNLGGGTITANLRHDGKNVKSIIKGEKIDTGRRKLGAVIGDAVHTGIHTSVYPGRKIWPEKTTLPGEIVKKDIV